MSNKILIIGACGQIGTELTQALRNKYGNENIVASDIRESDSPIIHKGPFEILDAREVSQIEDIIIHHRIDKVYHMAAMLSAIAEIHPSRAWNLNMNSLFNVLNLAKDGKIKRVFWPSSIAVFGPSTPSKNAPQNTIMDPTTVYGISKLAGERWCDYYQTKFNVDVRSVRYPGLISYKTQPGGGTTDYAIDIFFEALKKGKYTSFLDADTALPMMFMDDAIRATIELMDSPRERLSVKSSYNLGAMSFTPTELAEKIKGKIPGFTIDYKSDFRQSIADSWPDSVDDSVAKKDWGWESKIGLDAMVDRMFEGIQRKFGLEI